MPLPPHREDAKAPLAMGIPCDAVLSMDSKGLPSKTWVSSPGHVKVLEQQGNAYIGLACV